MSEEDSKKQGFGLHWMLSGSEGNCMIRHLDKTYQEGDGTVKLIL